MNVRTIIKETLYSIIGVGLLFALGFFTKTGDSALNDVFGLPQANADVPTAPVGDGGCCVSASSDGGN